MLETLFLLCALSLVGLWLQEWIKLTKHFG